MSAPINFCGQPNCTDGETPSSGIALTGPTIWGTTYHGGEYGYGTVYRYEDWTQPPGDYQVVYSFAGGSDGANPYGDFLAVEKSGLYTVGLYGVTRAGGAYGQGTIFKILPCGSPPCAKTNLHSFGGPGDDGIANGVIVQDGGLGGAHSFLYGTTQGGGAYGRGSISDSTSPPANTASCIASPEARTAGTRCITWPMGLAACFTGLLLMAEASVTGHCGSCRERR